MGDVKSLGEIFEELGLLTDQLRDQLHVATTLIDPTPQQLHDIRLDLLKMQEELA